jgi:hypothetical protein
LPSPNTDQSIKGFRFAVDNMCFVAVGTFRLLSRKDGCRIYHALITLTYSKHALPPQDIDKLKAFFLMLSCIRTQSKQGLLLMDVNCMKAFFLMLSSILTHSKHTLDPYSDIKGRHLAAKWQYPTSTKHQYEQDAFSVPVHPSWRPHGGHPPDPCPFQRLPQPDALQSSPYPCRAG